MNTFCTDRDLLGIEPVVFLSGGFPAQDIIAGADGVISATTFTSAGSDFSAAGVAAGNVLSVYPPGAAPSEGSAYEIVSVDSATSMTVSVLRAEADSEPVAPPAGQDLHFYVRTFAPQIRAISRALGEKLRQMAELSGIDAADFADSSQLQTAAANGVLSAVFIARAQTAGAGDTNWIKSQHYRKEFGRCQLQLRLSADADGDGRADKTRTLGHITLKRT